MLENEFLFVKKNKNYEKLHISSSYTKILGGKSFHTWEIPRNGSKAKDRKERLKVGNKNCQLRIATPPRVAHAKPPGPISYLHKWLQAQVVKIVHLLKQFIICKNINIVMSSFVSPETDFSDKYIKFRQGKSMKYMCIRKSLKLAHCPWKT